MVVTKGVWGIRTEWAVLFVADERLEPVHDADTARVLVANDPDGRAVMFRHVTEWGPL